MREKNNLQSWQLVNFCEFDKYATKSYCAIHGVDENLNLGDITKVDETKLEDFNMICGGSPCFVEGTLVLTEEGYKPIEQIKVGDIVLTHNNKWQKVVRIMTNETNELFRVKSMPSEDIHCTSNHPFYVRKRNNLQDSKTGKRWREFDEPVWIEAKNLSREYYVGTSINQKEELPEWNGIIKRVNATDKSYVENTLSSKFHMNEFWYIIGRYIGDGWIRNDSGIIICANDQELYQIIPYLENLGWNYCVSKERTVNKIHIAFKEIGEYCLRFGRGASNKHLTSDILDLPVDLLKAFIEGFVSSDGTQDSNGLYRITSVSREMIYELGQCVAKVYHRPFSIYFTQRPRTTVIEGRTVNQKDTYSIHYKLTTNTQDKAFYENGYIWSPINEVLQEEYSGLVYNLEVEEDNSYVVQNIIVHNCQDFSVAGKQKGSVWTCKDCGHEYNPLTVHWSKRNQCPHCSSKNIEKTRSSLLVEYLRVIRANKPNFGMYENVKNIVGKQFRDTTFKLFEEELHEHGYNTYWKVLNAKDYGIPQNRERVYLVFIKKDLDNGKFVFPKGFDNGIRLKDVLEDEVDEKYYISDDKVQRFLTNLNTNTFLLSVNENIVKQVGNISDCNGNWKNPQVGRIYDPEGCSPTLNTCGGGSHEPKILQVGKLNSSQDVIVVSNKGIAPTHTAGHGNTPKVLETPDYSYCLDANYYNGATIEQYVDKYRRQLVSEINETDDKTIIQKPRGFNKGGEHNICPTLSSHSWECNNFVKEQIRIRKLTPKECFRLMGFSDSAYEAASKVVSNSQLYKQSGNSIVVDVLYYILIELYKAMPYLFDDLKLSSFFSGIGAFEIALDRLYESINTGNFTKPQVE